MTIFQIKVRFIFYDIRQNEFSNKFFSLFFIIRTEFHSNHTTVQIKDLGTSQVLIKPTNLCTTKTKRRVDGLIESGMNKSKLNDEKSTNMLSKRPQSNKG